MSKSIDEILRGLYNTGYNHGDAGYKGLDETQDWSGLTKQAIYEVLKAEMPKHDPYYQNKVENMSDEQLKIWHNRTVGYNQCLDDVTKAINKLFSEGE